MNCLNVLQASTRSFYKYCNNDWKQHLQDDNSRAAYLSETLCGMKINSTCYVISGRLEFKLNR